MGTAISYMLCTKSGAAGYCLGTAIKYLRGAAGNGMGTTIKGLRGAAGIGQGTAIKYVTETPNERCRGQEPGHHDQVPATHNERRRGQRPGHRDQVSCQPKRGRRQQPGQGPLNKGQARILLNPPVVKRLCSKLRAPHRGTSLGSGVCGA
jgi:hypothetical protein